MKQMLQKLILVPSTSFRYMHTDFCICDHAHSWDRCTLYEAHDIQDVHTREVVNVHHSLLPHHCFKAGPLHSDSFQKTEYQTVFLVFHWKN